MTSAKRLLMSMSNYQLSSAKAFVLKILFAGMMLAGCSINRWIEVEPGEYTPVRQTGTVEQMAASTIQKMKIDRGQQIATIILADGSTVTVSYLPRNRSQWLIGCPTNIGATHLEVLDILETPLIIGSIAFTNPILVRDCPSDSVRFVLREDGLINSGGGACADLDKCVCLGKTP